MRFLCAFSTCSFVLLYGLASSNQAHTVEPIRVSAMQPQAVPIEIKVVRVSELKCNNCAADDVDRERLAFLEKYYAQNEKFLTHLGYREPKKQESRAEPTPAQTRYVTTGRRWFRRGY